MRGNPWVKHAGRGKTSLTPNSSPNRRGELSPRIERPWPRIVELQAALDTLEDGLILERLQAYRPTGRPGYPLKALWYAYVASFHLNLPHTNALIRELEDDPYLQETCGFDPDAPLPHRRTFNRFIQRLSNHADLVEACLVDLTDKLKTILPDLGEEVAIDASTVRTHSNPNHDTDPEASWGVSHSPQSRDKDGIEWVFGYKVHMVASANYGVPLTHFVTTGSRHESPTLPMLIEQAKRTHNWFAPTHAIADRGYDSAANHHAMWFEHNIVPIIHIRKPNAKDGLYDGIYTENGVPTCMGMVPMQYIATNGQGHHLYKCRQEGCHLLDSPQGGTRHCDTTYILDPNENIRVFGVLRRASRRWKHLYGKRWAVERLFKTMKESRRLERHCVRGFRQVNLHTMMSTLVYQASALAQAQAGNLDGMRWMVRRVA